MNPGPAIVRILWLVTLLLVLIGVTVAIRRTLHLFAPSPVPPGFPEAAALDSGFARHRLLTIVHIIPGLLFIVLALSSLSGGCGAADLNCTVGWGAWSLPAGIIIGSTALVMSPQMAIGGANETAATMLFAVVFLFALVKAFLSIRRGKVALHREWMIRAFAIGSSVATVRPIVGVFFATRSITHLTPPDFFGIAFWLGFTMHLIAAEIWINYTRPGIAVERRPDEFRENERSTKTPLNSRKPAPPPRVSV